VSTARFAAILRLYQEIEPLESLGASAEPKLLSVVLTIASLALDADVDLTNETPVQGEVLAKVGELLLNMGKAAQAAEMYALAAREASWREDTLRTSRYTLKVIEAAISALDFGVASELLARRISTVPMGSGVAASLEALSQPPEMLGATTLWLWSNLAASMGNPTGAAQAQSALLAHLNANPDRHINTNAVALRLAELHLTMVELNDFDAVFSNYSHAANSPLQRGLWLLRRCEQQIMEGDLSLALQRLNQLINSPHNLAAETIKDLAYWERAQLYSMLNRLEDAEADLLQLKARSAVSDEALTTVSDAVAARRETVASWTRAQAQIFAATTITELAIAPQLSNEPPGDDAPCPPQFQPLIRRYSDPYLDWAAAANTIRLMLHHGDVSAALAKFVPLDAWLTTVHSPLAATRHLLLRAQMMFGLGDYATSTKYGHLAADAARQLGLILDERAALDHVIKLEPDHTHNERSRRQAIENELRRILSADDLSTFYLNKSSVIDDNISSAYARLKQRLTKAHNIHGDEIRAFLRQALSARNLFDVNQDGVAPKSRSSRFAVLARWEQMLSDLALYPKLYSSSIAILVVISLPNETITIIGSREMGWQIIEPETPCGRVELWECTQKALRLFNTIKQYDPTKPVLVRLSKILGIQNVVAALPSNIKRLYFVPDGPTNALPISILPISSVVPAHEPRGEDKHHGVPLVSRYELTVHHSPTLGGRDTDRVNPRVSLGVSVSSLAKLPEMPTLKNASTEVEFLNKLTPGRVTRLQEEGALREATLTALPAADMAHFACHGRFDPLSRRNTGLLLTDDTLSIEDAVNLRLRRLKLIILSSCSSAVGSVLPNGRVNTLSGAMISAGAYMVLSTYADVDDEASLRFLRTLYGHLVARDPSSALSATQRELVDEVPLGHWAPYQLQARTLPSRFGLRQAINFVNYLLNKFFSR
jgi:hypothetical protein